MMACVHQNLVQCMHVLLFKISDTNKKSILGVMVTSFTTNALNIKCKQLNTFGYDPSFRFHTYNYSLHVCTGILAEKLLSCRVGVPFHILYYSF